MSAQSIIVYISMTLLAFGFFMAGTSKLTPALAPPAYEELVGKFKLFTPYILKEVSDKLKLSIVVTPDFLRQVVGSAEVVITVLLFTPLRKLAALGAFFIMAGALYVEIGVKGNAVPAAVLLTLSLIILLFSTESKSQKSTKKA